MQNPIPRTIKMIADRMKADGDARLKKHNMTFVQAMVLRHLRLHGGTATQKQLEDDFKVSHPTIVGIIARMENNGHVRSYTDCNDRRQKIVEMTEAGNAMEETIHSDIMERDRKLVEGLSEKDIAELNRMLEIIYRNLQS